MLSVSYAYHQRAIVLLLLAPKAFNAQMMSIWYLTNASAQAINGTLVKLIETTRSNKLMYFPRCG